MNLPDFERKLKKYINEFNLDDREVTATLIDNREAFDYLKDRIPFFECPDETLERTYYFRWWTFRKHWKQTPCGHILTEFLPDVPWAGPYNSIVCAVGHHLREGRWLRDPELWMREYIMFWLDRRGDALQYSSWLGAAVSDYLMLHKDPDFAERCLDKLVEIYADTEKKALRPCGLFWSNDGNDGMEYSVSGPGIRLTLNSYMYGNAEAISKIAASIGRMDLSKVYHSKAEMIKEKINLLLWDGDFYRNIPCDESDPADFRNRPSIEDSHLVRELVGYLPWYFNMETEGHGEAFRELKDPRGFYAPFGLTTAEQRHPRFMFEHTHECLWNGPVWPFATSQTLTAAANSLRQGGDCGIDKSDLYLLLHQFAASQRIMDPVGKCRMWIDENMDPYNGEWIARNELLKDHWNPERGGEERGKDYNHSAFCDLILDSLLGIRIKDGLVTADPLIPDAWDYFCVCHLPETDQTVLFDRYGTRYGLGKGLIILDGDSSVSMKNLSAVDRANEGE